MTQVAHSGLRLDYIFHDIYCQLAFSKCPAGENFWGIL